MFVPQAGKTPFNQSTLILIIRVFFAVLCPHFETEETKNKHAAPGKENTHEFGPLCLSVFNIGPTFFVPTPPPCRNPLAHPHKHIRYGKKIQLVLLSRLTRFEEGYMKSKQMGAKELIFTGKSCKMHVNNTCTQVCHMRCRCRAALCGRCAGQSAAQSLCGPLCIITAVSVPAKGEICLQFT